MGQSGRNGNGDRWVMGRMMLERLFVLNTEIWKGGMGYDGVSNDCLLQE